MTDREHKIASFVLFFQRFLHVIVASTKRTGKSRHPEQLEAADVIKRLFQYVMCAFFAAMLAFSPGVIAAPYAALVMDARSGKVLHSRNADTRLHPASLTKMMTLYVAFEAVERGEISLDTRVKISRNAAAEPPSKLGLRRGQSIKLRYLIRAAAVKSANDAATAIGEAISGSEAAFTRRMTRTARAMGMKNTNFKNAHGLTQSGHYSTARDMSILGRHILYDYPQYYNLFSRRKTDAGVRSVSNTNSRLLANYRGADGIKTGYTRAAGFNLVASANRGRERVIATVFGGKSTASRNARVAELLDMGFSRSPTFARLRRPALPAYVAPTRKPTQNAPKVVVAAKPQTNIGRTVRATTAVKRSLRPNLRPFGQPEVLLIAAAPVDIENALEQAAKVEIAPKPVAPTRPLVTASVTPKARPAAIMQAAVIAAPTVEPSKPAPLQVEIVPRLVNTGQKTWGINVGKYPSRHQAERVLLRMALAEMQTLDGAERTVKQRNSGYDALFVGMSRDSADLACRRLQAQRFSCLTISPG